MATSPREEPSSQSASLQCALSVAPRLKVGEPVQVTFRLSNPTKQPLYVLNWHTPLEGLLSNCLEVTRAGTEIPYQGPMFKRADPEASDYVTLAPGGSAENTIEASLAYDFSQPGTYRIAFTRPLMDVTSQQAEVPHRLGQHHELPVQCQAAETTIVTP
ncbi:protease [Hyalangium sp.]|uniref:protease n=1 Tax=Hyalangium sp. TaxID=2028555 RepID=UPI002D7116DF|nr:protease [Hyalangium sp.]HYH96290.1 protease [Hyalangium sp.]